MDTDKQLINWESEIIYPEKGKDIQYAYILMDSDEVVECSKCELLKLLKSKKSKLSYITTPEHDSFIIPGSDYISMVPILYRKTNDLEEEIESNKEVFYLSLGIIVFNFLMEGLRINSMSLIMLILVILPQFERFYELKKIKRITENNFFSESLNIKFSHWLTLKKNKSIYVITVIIVFVYVFQFYIGTLESAELAGLDKIKTIKGEYWRILTAIMMHGSIFHVLINGLVLFYIGSMVIRVTNIYIFGLVSLLSGVLGNLFSVFFVPIGVSVGASGTLMGLIGFTIVMGIKFKKSMPQKITSSMIRFLVLTGFLGLVAWDVIDNAAHAGGLIGGFILGFILLNRNQYFLPVKSNILINSLGLLSLVILFAGFLLLMWLFIQSH
jgi:rhomboid protease GluP